MTMPVKRLRDRPLPVTLVAYALAAAAAVGIAAAYGLDSFARAWTQLQPGWLALAIGAQLLAIPAYVIAYRAVARTHGGPDLPWALAARVVAAGFGPFAVGGGFALDRRALYAIEDDQRAATARVLGLGALEWALLAPAAWMSAVALLASGHPKAMPSLLWPWAIAVPVGFGLGLWLTSPSRRTRTSKALRGRGEPLLRGVGTLHVLARDLPTCWSAWVGTALYWILDIASFYGAARFLGLHIGVDAAILAYATGYAVTRRSLPLGGAGATEALMTFALHWVGQPVPASLAAVLVYRAFNFVLPTLPALLARPRIKPLLDATDEGRTPAPVEHRRAAAALGSGLRRGEAG